MDKNLISEIKKFAKMAENLGAMAPQSEEEFDKLPNAWQEFFEECANVVNVVYNLPEMEG